MAKLPKPFDVEEFWIRNLLHRGRREDAIAKLQAAIDSGNAGAETLELAEYLRTAGRGRQPFGVKHLWIEIGALYEQMKDDGIPRSERFQALRRAYPANDESDYRKMIGKYRRAIAIYHNIIQENP